MRLLLIRHGQTPYNVTGALDTGSPGPDLTPLGRAQADAIPQALAHEPIEAVFVSELVRTHQTAGPLLAARRLESTPLGGLNEISAGEYDMRSDAEAVDAYRRCGSRWAAGDLDAHLPGAEDGHAFLARFQAATETIAQRCSRNATVAIFGHGAAIRVFATIAAGLDPSTPAEHRLLNTGLVELVGDPRSGWRMERWCDLPIGGSHLADETAHDVTADPAAEPAHQSPLGDARYAPVRGVLP